MGLCVLCSSRPAKRYCPAKEAEICGVCCGSKREIEIDCPLSCVYLKAAYAYESEKRTPDPAMVARARSFDQQTIDKHAPALDFLTQTIALEFANSPNFVDADFIEVAKALSETLKTLSNGIIYDFAPTGGTRRILFSQLRAALDKLMSEQIGGVGPLKVSEAQWLVEFLTFAAEIHSGGRPKSRRYLNWVLSSRPQNEASPSNLILP